MNKIGKIYTINATAKQTASVIFLHGSGDTGKGIVDWIKFLIKDFGLPHVNFIFPTAPLQPYTYLGGELSNVWFDRYDLSPNVSENAESLHLIQEQVKEIINTQVKLGIALNRIVIGGFSMGGALSLQMAYRFQPGLAGVFALSSFLSKNSEVYQNFQSQETPLYMCHGDRDDLVPLQWGKDTFDRLTKLGVKGEFVTLKNTMHELKKHELLGLLEFLTNTCLP